MERGGGLVATSAQVESSNSVIVMPCAVVARFRSRLGPRLRPRLRMRVCARVCARARAGSQRADERGAVVQRAVAVVAATLHRVHVQMANVVFAFAARTHVDKAIDVALDVGVDLSAEVHGGLAWLLEHVFGDAATTTREGSPHGRVGSEVAAEAAAHGARLARLSRRCTLWRDVVLSKRRHFIVADMRCRGNPGTTSSSRCAAVSTIELALNLVHGWRLRRPLFGRLGALLHPLTQVGKGIEPCLMAFACSCSEFDRTAWCSDNQALLMKTRRRWIQIIDLLNRLDRHTLGLKLSLAGCLWVPIAPVQCPCVRVDPEEATMASVGHATPHGSASVLPKELADHSLSDCLDHARVGGTWKQPRRRERWSTCHIKALVDLRRERGDR